MKSTLCRRSEPIDQWPQRETLQHQRCENDADGEENNGRALWKQLFAQRVRERQRGGKPFVIPIGGSTPTGALGYVGCAQEILQQAILS